MLTVYAVINLRMFPARITAETEKGKAMRNECALTKEQVNEAYKMCVSGETLGEVAKQFFVHKETLRNSFKRCGLRLPQRARPVKNLTTGERYPSITAAGKACRLDAANIRMVCNGERKTCGGMVWKYDGGNDNDTN